MNREFKIIFDQILAISDIKREFVLGLSGGPDSICLLNLIRDYTKLVNITGDNKGEIDQEKNFFY